MVLTSNRAANAPTDHDHDGQNGKDIPFVDDDLNKPDPGYWSYLDYIVDKANQLGLYVNIFPAWHLHFEDGISGDDDTNIIWSPIIKTTADAEKYAAFIGNRYKNKRVLWTVGGDDQLITTTALRYSLYNAFGQALRSVVGNQLIAYHGKAGLDPVDQLGGNNPTWMNYLMAQSGHNDSHTLYLGKTVEISLDHGKPVLDGEAYYENHTYWNIGLNMWQPSYFSTDYEIRKAHYWSAFAGSAGNGYGEASVFSFFDPDHYPPEVSKVSLSYLSFSQSTDWKNGMNAPGADQMKHLKNLMQSRPYGTASLNRTMITSSTGSNGTQMGALKGSDFTFIYLPVLSNISINMGLFGCSFDQQD
jgi:hypothetical protein